MRGPTHVAAGAALALIAHNYAGIGDDPYLSFLAKKTPSSRSVKGHSPVSRWEMNWLRTRDGRKPS
ncbi:hypothetical protein [Bacillus tropicus]|uniref:hypothetical protein n=1 Tax=Bacillus tropicus TaxID=2026188 RepID=UPI003D1B8AA0